MRWLLAFLCCFAVVPDAPAAELGEARASMDGIHDKPLILLDSSARRRALRVALSTTDGLTQPHLLTWADATAIANGPDGDWTYTYDAFGNLLRAQQTGGDDVEYVTNAQHQRIGRRVNGGPWTWWLYAGGLTPVAEYDADFRLRKVFVYGPGHAPDHVITYDAAGLQTARYRFVTDQAGSILGLVDDAGAWVLAYDYTPFGRRTLLSAAPGIDESLTPFGFAAGLHDPTTRLVRFGARDYDPHTARWMAKDPIDFAGGDTNLYAYVGGDPVNLVDPSGLQKKRGDMEGVTVKAQQELLELQHRGPVDIETHYYAAAELDLAMSFGVAAPVLARVLGLVDGTRRRSEGRKGNL
ncbi:MAG: RHS repeat-associated core domain-containing protein [bacterium]